MKRAQYVVGSMLLVVGLTPAQAILVQPSDLSYVGGFMTPKTDEAGIQYILSGVGAAYDAESHSLFVATYDHRVTEITIEPPTMGPSSDWSEATVRQPKTNVLRGRLRQAGDRIGGLLLDGDDLIVSSYIYYDNRNSRAPSHFRVPKDFSQTSVNGPVRLSQRPGMVGGYMAPIPSGWQEAFGGTALTGQYGVPVITRTSFGPAASVFTPSEIESSEEDIRSTQVLAYPSAHRNLGDWNSDGSKGWNGPSIVGGFVFIEGTSSVLYFGRKASGFCYGDGPKCGDPTWRHSGTHGYPYTYWIWAYDAADLLAVKNGRKRPWDVKPYATWEPTVDSPLGSRILRGVAYDPSAQRIYVLEENQPGGGWAGVRVFDVNVASGALGWPSRSGLPRTLRR